MIGYIPCALLNGQNSIYTNKKSYINILIIITIFAAPDPYWRCSTQNPGHQQVCFSTWSCLAWVLVYTVEL